MNIFKRTQLDMKIGFICFLCFIPIYIFIRALYEQPFICDKSKDICYTTTFGFIHNEEVKISDLEGITIKTEKITVTRGNRRHRRHEQATTYMPTLITKSGKSFPFYKNPTENSYKAEQDKKDFTDFIKGNAQKLELKNSDNIEL